jgi:hypothetical protein
LLLGFIMNLKRLLSYLQLTVILSLVACGGGSSDSGSSLFGGGTTGGGATGKTVADLSISLDKLSVANSGTDSVAVTVTAVDSSRNALSGVPVSISADNNAVVLPSGNATGTTGTISALVGIGADRSNRVISVRVTSGGLERIAAFQVVGAKLVGTPLPAVVVAGAANNRVDYRLIDSTSNPMSNIAITVEGSGVPTTSGVTGVNGDFSYTYAAPAAAGALTITARAGGTTASTQVEVQSAGGGSRPPAIGTILSASVSANPSVVGINEGTSTANRSDIRALFLGANNAPIANVRVKFDLNGDQNSIGGTLSSGIGLVYADLNGVANVSYIPASRSSPTDGVTVRACYGNTDAEANACTRFAVTTLTVTSEPLAVSIGFNNEIEQGTGGLTYIRKFVVLVADAAGRAKADVQITPSIDLVRYFKGSLGFLVPPLDSANLNGRISAVCLNEDLNRNGINETGEDLDNDGRLDPGKSDVTIRVLGTGRTSENGTVTVQIEYAENYGLWLEYRILVSASGVSGTEGRASLTDVLGVAADDLSGASTPAFYNSPYGLAPSCTDRN